MMFSSSVKKKQSKPIKDDKEISSTESTADNDNYNLKISESSNYVKFLQLTLEGPQSDDEGSHGDLDGYIEDDFILSECDADVDASDLTEAGKVVCMGDPFVSRQNPAALFISLLLWCR